MNANNPLMHHDTSILFNTLTCWTRASWPFFFFIIWCILKNHDIVFFTWFKIVFKNHHELSHSVMFWFCNYALNANIPSNKPFLAVHLFPYVGFGKCHQSFRVLNSKFIKSYQRLKNELNSDCTIATLRARTLQQSFIISVLRLHLKT